MVILNIAMVYYYYYTYHWLSFTVLLSSCVDFVRDESHFPSPQMFAEWNSHFLSQYLPYTVQFPFPGKQDFDPMSFCVTPEDIKISQCCSQQNNIPDLDALEKINNENLFEI